MRVLGCCAMLLVAAVAQDTVTLNWGFKYSETPRKGYTDVVIFKDASQNGVFAQIPRVGSSPGRKNAYFQVNLDVGYLTTNQKPTLISETAYNALNISTEIEQSYYADTFYWENDVSVQIVRYVPGVTTGNVMGFSRGSDIWQEFEWMEICPRHRKIVLHRGDGGDFNDPLAWTCGEGSKPIASAENCLSVNTCPFGAQNPVYVQHFTFTPQPDANVTLNGVEMQAYTFKPEGEPVTDYIVQADSAGLFTIYNGRTGKMHVAKEFRYVHTHSWAAFIIPLVIGFLLWHWYADGEKEKECAWTRVPQEFGICIALVCATAIHQNYKISECIFHTSPVFRLSTDIGKTISWMFYVTNVIYAIIVHVFNYWSFRKSIRLEVLHRRFFYEMILIDTLTLEFLPGIPDHLMRLLFVFVFTIFILFSRCLHFMDIYHALQKNPSLATWIDKSFIAWQAFYTVGYFTFCILAIWAPAMERLFLLQAYGVNYTAAFGLLAILVVYVVLEIQTKKLYTFGDFYTLNIRVNNGKRLEQKNEGKPLKYIDGSDRSYAAFASSFSFITGAGAGFAASLQGKYRIFMGKHAIVGILLATFLQNLLVFIVSYIDSATCQTRQQRNRWALAFSEFREAINTCANIVTIFVGSLTTGWVLTYLKANDFEATPWSYFLYPIFIPMFMAHAIKRATTQRVKIQYVQ